VSHDIVSGVFDMFAVFDVSDVSDVSDDVVSVDDIVF